MIETDGRTMTKRNDRQHAKSLKEKPYKVGLQKAQYFLPGAASSPERKPLKVCILACDIVGPIRNGGIGTAYTYLARFLKHHGHDVTILYTLGKYCEIGTIDQWIEFYNNEEIEFIPLPHILSTRFADNGISDSVRQSYDAMAWLKDKQFDVVHVSEWRGIGYFPLLAKRLGLLEHPPHFVVKCSSPTLWANKGGWQLPMRLVELSYERLERCSVEWADTVISGSSDLLDWMIEHGYDLPAETYSHKNILPLIDDFLDGSKTGKREQVDELVFFGRLEPRKGIELFCRALDMFRHSDVKPRKITFLGKRSNLFNIKDALAARNYLGIEFEIIDNASQPEAIRYLKEPGRLAVMPSILENSSFCIYECLAYGIPFVASGTGGNPELVAQEYHDEVMFPLMPSAIFKSIVNALKNGAINPAPSFSFEESESIWSDWHYSLSNVLAAERSSRKTSAIESISEPPLISVCLSTYNRSHGARRAIESIKAQDYPNIEILVVDDGTDNPYDMAEMRRIADELHSEGHRVVFQENQYLGAVRNKCISEARGEYLFFHDDDNVALPGEIKKMFSAMQKTGCDILTTFGYKYVEEDDEFASYEEIIQKDLSHCDIIPFLGGGLALGLFKNVFGDSNSLLKKQVAIDVGGFTTDYGIIQEDHEFFAKCVLAGKKLLVYPEPTYIYRWSNRGMMRSQSAIAGRLRVARAYTQHIPRELEQIIYMAQSQFFENNKNANFVRLMTPWIESIGEVSELMKNMTKKG